MYELDQLTTLYIQDTRAWKTICVNVILSVVFVLLSLMEESASF